MSTDDVTAKFRSAGMIVDGWIIPEDPSITFAANRQNPVDVLVGSNKEESFFRADVTPAQFEERARMRWGDLADEYLALYPHATDAEAADSVAQDFSDGAFWHMRLFADYQAKRGNKAWLFYFAQNPPSPAGEPPRPATHASEVPYVFNNLGELPLFPDRSVAELAKASAPDQKVADQMSSYWVNFARTGDPNGAGLPAWQPHEPLASERAAILDADPASERTPDPARLAVARQALRAGASTARGALSLDRQRSAGASLAIVALARQSRIGGAYFTGLDGHAQAQSARLSFSARAFPFMHLRERHRTGHTIPRTHLPQRRRAVIAAPSHGAEVFQRLLGLRQGAQSPAGSGGLEVVAG